MKATQADSCDASTSNFLGLETYSCLHPAGGNIVTVKVTPQASQGLNSFNKLFFSYCVVSGPVIHAGCQRGKEEEPGEAAGDLGRGPCCGS